MVGKIVTATTATAAGVLLFTTLTTNPQTGGSGEVIDRPITKLETLIERRSIEADLAAWKEVAVASQAELARVEAQLADREAQLADTAAKLGDTEAQLADTAAKLGDTEAQLARAEAKLAEAEKRRTQQQPQTQSNADTYEATHYTAKCKGCSGVTATGLNVSHTIYSPDGFRIVAVDPRVIPLGTKLQITYANGVTFKAVAADTGGAIKGKKIDILVASKSEAYRLGRVPVTVRILNN